MRLEWDENKNEANRKKHGISFETARLVFNDTHCLFVLDRIEGGEQRWHAIGTILNGAAVLTVVHTEIHEGTIRIISARRSRSKTPMSDLCKDQMEDLLMKLNPTLSKEQASEALAVINLRDEDIDLSDIPEITEERLGKGVRGLFYDGPIVRLTEDLRAYFWEIARRKKVPLNDLVNETLAKAVAVAEVAK